MKQRRKKQGRDRVRRNARKAKATRRLALAHTGIGERTEGDE